MVETPQLQTPLSAPCERQLLEERSVFQEMLTVIRQQREAHADTIVQLTVKLNRYEKERVAAIETMTTLQDHLVQCQAALEDITQRHAQLEEYSQRTHNEDMAHIIQLRHNLILCQDEHKHLKADTTLTS